MSSTFEVKQLLLFYFLLLVQQFNRLLEESRAAVKSMSFLYLCNDNVVECHLISELMPLFLSHGLIGLNQALVKTGNLHMIIEI